ncbi:PhzF family phenazine biosynthesis protein [Nocardioides euryhalodurans]|uniref:PhzF family phenazine biosynthesis protein n=1 Tax=Nocardioides euryhalodurans TaxID=2518370 RepID=A0A4P7GHR9_9ACTN|nr:PhzF family phenazine biosynthesis protein [Nocardioides euryhalodurans]QBR91460.1 PhzF family phenazine biosynthesis protein [Nocardioides euryhalodurans]
MRSFRQVDVFSHVPVGGNPVAVVHDAEGLDEARMQAFAHWTNLSETTFLLPPTTPDADYRLRIFTPAEELPFAGHPTIGSAHAWLEAGGTPASSDRVVQECGAGLVTVRRSGRLAFAAPPLTRSGPVDLADRARIAVALGVDESELLELAWIDNGPGWVGVLLRDDRAVLDLDPDWSLFGELKIGVVGPRAEGDTACEVRAFCPGYGIPEDPVTGSLNAGIAQWLAGTVLPTAYVAAQGTVLGRTGRVHVERDGDTVWIGGDARTVVRGDVSLD